MCVLQRCCVRLQVTSTPAALKGFLCMLVGPSVHDSARGHCTCTHKDMRAPTRCAMCTCRGAACARKGCCVHACKGHTCMPLQGGAMCGRKGMLVQLQGEHMHPCKGHCTSRVLSRLQCILCASLRTCFTLRSTFCFILHVALQLQGR